LTYPHPEERGVNETPPSLFDAPDDANRQLEALKTALQNHPKLQLFQLYRLRFEVTRHDDKKNDLQCLRTNRKHGRYCGNQSDPQSNSTVLFAKGRLSLEILRCRIVPEPLAWLRGAQAGDPVLVLENAVAFDTFRRWDKEICPTFSAIIYGHGNTVRFRDGVLFLREIFAEIGGGCPVFYFGDLDPAGLRIPQTASDTAIKNNLPRIRPLLCAYRELCEKTPRPNIKNTGKQKAADSGNADSENGMEMDEISSNEADLAWLEVNTLIQFARDVFTSNQRIPQEALGWEHLKNIHADSV
jgi:hypothetical protein